VVDDLIEIPAIHIEVPGRDDQVQEVITRDRLFAAIDPRELDLEGPFVSGIS